MSHDALHCSGGPSRSAAAAAAVRCFRHKELRVSLESGAAVAVAVAAPRDW